MRISQLAGSVGLPTSTVRYYERIGLLTAPERTTSGYRDYDEQAASRLLFVHRARQLGLSCDQVSELLPVWGGADCGAAQDRVLHLIARKKAEIAERVAELELFAAQLESVRVELESSPAPAACRTDLSCCVPAQTRAPVHVELITHPYT